MRFAACGRWPGVVLGALALLAITTGCGSVFADAKNYAAPAGLDAFTPNYARSVELLWWRSFPRKVAFRNDCSYGGVNMQASAAAGINAWQAATDGVIDYQWVSKPGDADITVDFESLPSTPAAGSEVGDCKTMSDAASNRLSSARITIDLWDGLTIGEAKRKTQECAVHEMGHALGIMGHSPDRADVMYMASTALTPTERDINTMKTLYAKLFGRSFLPMPEDGGVLITRTIH